MRKTTLVLFTVLLTLAALVPALAGDPPFYTKRSTWYETMRLSREGLMKYQAGIKAMEKSMLGPWYVIGPFPSDHRRPFEESFPPETEIALGKKYDDGKFKWMKRDDWQNGRAYELPHINYSATYLYRTVTASHDTTMSLYLGSDDGIKVWINGTLALLDSSNRAVAANQDTASIHLKAGKNDLLMKISNGEGEYAFYFSLSPFNTDMLWDIVERDFSRPDLIREMYWERQDSIWDKDWKPGDVRAIANRYARAYDEVTDQPGKSAKNIAASVRSASDLATVREAYVEARRREMTDLIVLTPRESPAPRVNGARIYGVRPGHPFLYRIPATGQRPMTFAADNLPAGLSLDPSTGIITGMVASPGEYAVTLRAKNALGSAERQFRIVVGNRIALTPPLGWNSWNCFANAVDDKKVRLAAEAMVNSGLVNHGWSYINIDDCWSIKPGSAEPDIMGEPRDANGMINTNRKFPDMKALGEYVHGLGLKLGIYSSPGPLTCAGFTASYQHELQDARQYAHWGIDYLKYDWCSYGQIARDTARAEFQKPYRVMRAALDSVDRDIVFSLCQYGMDRVWEWGDEVGGNSWRTTGDITDTWQSMSGIGFEQNGHEKYAGPGHWNDPDMLVVGYVGWGPQLHPTRLTPNEQITHISLWSLLCSPLLIGCDMTRFDDFTLSLLSNDEVIEVNQDPLGRQAKRILQKGTLEVWAKDMEDGSKAVGLFNRGTKKTDVTVTWQDLGITGKQSVRDLWRQRDEGTFDNHFTAPVLRHSAVLVRITPEQ